MLKLPHDEFPQRSYFYTVWSFLFLAFLCGADGIEMFKQAFQIEHPLWSPARGRHRQWGYRNLPIPVATKFVLLLCIFSMFLLFLLRFIGSQCGMQLSVSQCDFDSDHEIDWSHERATYNIFDYSSQHDSCSHASKHAIHGDDCSPTSRTISNRIPTSKPTMVPFYGTYGNVVPHFQFRGLFLLPMARIFEYWTSSPVYRVLHIFLSSRSG